MKCKECGNEFVEDAKFCPQCGKPVINNKIICKNCNYEMDIKSKFCPECGELVQKNFNDKGRRDKDYKRRREEDDDDDDDGGFLGGIGDIIGKIL